MRPITPIERAVARIQKILGHTWTRALLSAAIILSLVPHESLGLSDEWFMLIFIPEFVARLFIESRWESVDEELRVREAGWRWPTVSATTFLFFDFVALLSFLPLAGSDTARWFRLFRLTRMAMLIRYWAPMLRDLWAVFMRDERSKQIMLMGMAVMIMSFAGAVVLNHATDDIGDDYDGDGVVGSVHDHDFWVRVWWAFRQVQDPGNLLASPHETATLFISITLTAFGLFLVSFLIGLGTDVVGEVMELTKIRPANLRRHTVVINVETNTKQLLFELIKHARKHVVGSEGRGPFGNRIRQIIRNRRAARQFVVVGRDHDPPDFLREPELARIVYRRMDEDDHAVFMQRADVPYARRIVLMADESLDSPDDETVHTLVTIVEQLRADENQTGAHLVAEVMDESNVMAARRAIMRASGKLEAHVVPTERLLGLFAAAVARRAGVGRIFADLLNASGNELYTYTFSSPVSQHSADFIDNGLRHGASLPAEARVLPIGVLVADGDSVRLRLNPARGGGQDQVAGFVAIARSDEFVREFAAEHAANRPDGGQVPMLTLEPEPALALRTALICGFRSATVRLIEALAVSGSGMSILVMVADEAERDAAMDAFDATISLVREGTLRGQAHFQRVDDATIEVSTLDRSEITMVKIAVGDCTSSRQMRHLPCGFENAADLDAVIFIASDLGHSDARTTTALMKLEHLYEEYESPNAIRRVLVETVSADLAERLHLRYRDMGMENFYVYSVRELRALLLFQATVVPHFDLIYEEIAAPWRPSFERRWVKGERSGEVSFGALSRAAREQGALMVAVEMEDDYGRPVLRIAEGDRRREDRVDLARLRAVWVLEDETSSPASLLMDARTIPPSVPDAPVSPSGAQTGASEVGAPPPFAGA